MARKLGENKSRQMHQPVYDFLRAQGGRSNSGNKARWWDSEKSPLIGVSARLVISDLGTWTFTARDKVVYTRSPVTGVKVEKPRDVATDFDEDVRVFGELAAAISNNPQLYLELEH